MQNNTTHAAFDNRGTKISKPASSPVLHVFSASLRFLLRATLAISLFTPLLEAQSVVAEKGNVTGRVLNQATGKYLSNAIVRIEGTKIETVTDEDGYYRFSGVPVGEVRISVDYTDLDRAIQTVTVASGKTTTATDVGMTAPVYQLEKFVVSGDREGSAYATQEQRMSTSQKAIFAADSFGNVVDSNIGELMKNMPGVTIDYSGEDAGSMRIRGMDPELANVTLDGNEVASVSYGDEGASRAFNLKTQSLQNVESIEIKIAPTAEDSASSMGGLVNIRTKSALKQKGRRISFTANLSLNTSELDFDKTPGGSRTPDYKIMPGFNFSWSEAFGKKRPLGVAFNVGFNRNYRYNNSYTLPAGYVYDRSDVAQTNYIVTPETTGYVPRVQWTERGSSSQNRMISLNLDYQLFPSTVVYLYSSFNDIKGLGSYDRSMWVGQEKTGASTQPPEANLYNMVVPSGATANITNRISAGNDTNYAFSFGAKHTFGSLKINYGASFSGGNTDPDPDKNYSINYSSTGMGLNVYGLAGNATGKIVQTSNGGQDIVTADDSASYQNISNYSRLSLKQDFYYGTDERRGANFDVEFPVVLNLFGAHMVPLSFKAGARYGEQERETHRYYRNKRMTGNSGNYNYGSASEPKLAQFADPYFKNSWGFDVPIPTWLSPYYVMDYYDAHPNEFYAGADDPTDRTVHPLYYELKGERSSKESTTAGYVQMTARLLHNLTMIAGVRYESTETINHSFTNETPSDLRFSARIVNYNPVTGLYEASDKVRGKFDAVSPLWINEDGTSKPNPYYGLSVEEQIRLCFTPLTRERSYARFFPNLQFTWNPAKNINVRLAATQNMGKPSFNDTMRDDRWRDNYMYLERANPDLKPQSSTKFDVAFEYYFKKNGSFTLSLFRQDFKDYIVKDGNVSYLRNAVSPNDVPESGFDPDGTEVVYEPQQPPGMWTVFSPTNEGTGCNQGFEVSYKQRLQFLADWLKDFQVYASFSYADPTTEYFRRPQDSRPVVTDYATAAAFAEAAKAWLALPKERYEIPMRGIQKQSATLQLQYLGRRFNGTIRAYWVDKFARSINTSNYMEVNYQAAYTRFDLSLTYKINSRWSASFDWRNMTDVGDTRNIFDRTGGYYTSGMVVNLGVKANF